MHTPGPWKIAEAVESKTQPSMRRVRCEAEGIEHGAVCEVYGIRDGSTAAANARLIAAAPELLANLEFAVKLLSGFLAVSGTAQVEHMREVIRKAKGVSHEPA